MSSRGPLHALRPDQSIPIRRISRYALYALTVFAAGTVAAALVHGVLNYVTYLLGLSVPMANLLGESVDLLRTAIRAFAALVALGVFLTQFEVRE